MKWKMGTKKEVILLRLESNITKYFSTHLWRPWALLLNMTSVWKSFTAKNLMTWINKLISQEAFTALLLLNLPYFPEPSTLLTGSSVFPSIDLRNNVIRAAALANKLSLLTTYKHCIIEITCVNKAETTHWLNQTHLLRSQSLKDGMIFLL